MNENELSRVITDAATAIHDTVKGAGLDEPTYRSLLVHELTSRGLTVQRRIVPPGSYNGVKTTQPTIAQVVVNDLVLVECQERPFTARTEAEVLGKLRVTGLKLALVITFNAAKIRDGIRRVQNADA